MQIPLVADVTKTIAADYGVLLEDIGIALRGLFLIDPEGVLQQITVNNLPVGRNVDETIRLIQAFQFVAKHGEVRGDGSLKKQKGGLRKRGEDGGRRDREWGGARGSLEGGPCRPCRRGSPHTGRLLGRDRDMKLSSSAGRAASLNCAHFGPFCRVRGPPSFSISSLIPQGLPRRVDAR